MLQKPEKMHLVKIPDNELPIIIDNLDSILSCTILRGTNESFEAINKIYEQLTGKPHDSMQRRRKFTESRKSLEKLN